MYKKMKKQQPGLFATTKAVDHFFNVSQHVFHFLQFFQSSKG